MTDPDKLREAAIMLADKDMPTWEADVRLVADHLEKLEKRWAEAVELLERERTLPCGTPPMTKHCSCFSCTAKRLLADAPKGGGDES